MLFPEEQLQQLLNYFSEDKRELIKQQIIIIEEIIQSDVKKYQFYPGYREAIDLVLQKIMQGKMVGE